MTSLRALNLSSNSIATLPDDLLQGMARLKILDIHDMELTRLPETFIPKGVFLNFADFSNNLWICDCDIVWLPKLMRWVASWCWLCFVSAVRRSLKTTVEQNDSRAA